MFTGVFVLLFGLAVNSASLVCFFAPQYVSVHVWEPKEIEEPELGRRMGDESIEYRRQTPMFFRGSSQDRSSESLPGGQLALPMIIHAIIAAAAWRDRGDSQSACLARG